MSDDRLARQLAFLIEVDRLKGVLRRTHLADSSRPENSAEHAWHLVLMAMLMRERAATPVDLLHVIEMIAVHDLVEIDAGDTFAYDTAAQPTKADREATAADRIFGLLPADQATRLRTLWDEFEAHQTPESRFAHALDRLQPLLLDACAGGGTCRNVERAQVIERMAPVETAMPELWPTVLEIIDAFTAQGIFADR